MQNKIQTKPITGEMLVDLIWDAYQGFFGKPGLIGKIEAYNGALYSFFGAKPLNFGSSNKPLLTENQYRHERNKGLSDEQIGATYRVVSKDQIRELSKSYSQRREKSS